MEATKRVEKKHDKEPSAGWLVPTPTSCLLSMHPLVSTLVFLLLATCFPLQLSVFFY